MAASLSHDVIDISKMLTKATKGNLARFMVAIVFVISLYDKAGKLRPLFVLCNKK